MNHKKVGDGRETENHINKSKEIVEVKQKITKDWFEQDYGTILNSDRNWFTFDTKRVEVLW